MYKIILSIQNGLDQKLSSNTNTTIAITITITITITIMTQTTLRHANLNLMGLASSSVSAPIDDLNQHAQLCFSCADGDLGAVRALVACGVDLLATNLEGRTALHVAAASGHADGTEKTICSTHIASIA